LSCFSSGGEDGDALDASSIPCGLAMGERWQSSQTRLGVDRIFTGLDLALEVSEIA
jgi:hypothetical protein